MNVKSVNQNMGIKMNLIYNSHGHFNACQNYKQVFYTEFLPNDYMYLDFQIMKINTDTDV